MSPAHFEEELKEKVFSFDADRTVCAGLYRGVAEPLLAAVEKLTFTKLKGWTAADWRHMGGALACCPKLRVLKLNDMGADDAAMAAFGGALGSGAAPALEELVLYSNQIGDEGARHLGDALARGAAPALVGAQAHQRQDLPRGAPPGRRPRSRGARDGHGASRRSAEGRAQGKWTSTAPSSSRTSRTRGAELQDLSWGGRGAPAMAALESARSQGAPALKTLYLWGNKIGDSPANGA